MSAAAIVERVKTNLVALKMPRALEILDVTMRGVERGEIGALEAIDALLVEELTIRENRRIKMAVQMAKLAAIKAVEMVSRCGELCGNKVFAACRGVVSVWTARRKRAENAEAGAIGRAPCARTVARLLMIGRDQL